MSIISFMWWLWRWRGNELRLYAQCRESVCVHQGMQRLQSSDTVVCNSNRIADVRVVRAQRAQLGGGEESETCSSSCMRVTLVISVFSSASVSETPTHADAHTHREAGREGVKDGWMEGERDHEHRFEYENTSQNTHARTRHANARGHQ